MLFSICLIGLLKVLPVSVHVSLYADTAARYLSSRGLYISPEKSAALAFTMKQTYKYPINLEGTPIPYVSEHAFLGVTLDRQMTWGPHIKRLKKKLPSFTHIIKMISGTRWGCSVSALMALYNALFVGLMRYTLPVMQLVSRSCFKELESAQAQALRVCFGLPKYTSTSGTLAESRAKSPAILRTQETLRAHLRHKTRVYKHHLVDIVKYRPSSGFAQVIMVLEDYMPSSIEAAAIPQYPPWKYPHLEIRTSIPGITKKNSTPSPVITQISLEYIQRTYESFTHIYTDGSTIPTSSALGVYIPSTATYIKAKLSHATSSTATELAAIRAAVVHAGTESPRCWAILVDSRSALYALSSIRKDNINSQLVHDILQAIQYASHQGHHFIFQWIPGHSGIIGNVCADRAAKDAHESTISVSIPFSRSDANHLIESIGNEISLSLWENPQYYYYSLHRIDPKLEFRIPRGLPRKLETVLHRLRLNVAYTKYYLHKIGKAESSDCSSCRTTHNIEHVLCACGDYSIERTALKTRLKLKEEDQVDLKLLFGPWPST
ncbi:uncharacterized protein LOC115311305, partial [Ixodes scapularis]|uniref:uncharacterized protein LOC115311305 n=1 Tax=Ixodes scapularis TaxID=6945 RepID=UPI001A9F8B4A